jgi:hypothetical protein
MFTFATRRPARPHDAPHDVVREKNLSHVALHVASHVGAHVALSAPSALVPAELARSTP